MARSRRGYWLGRDDAPSAPATAGGRLGPLLGAALPPPAWWLRAAICARTSPGVRWSSWPRQRCWTPPREKAAAAGGGGGLDRAAAGSGGGRGAAAGAPPRAGAAGRRGIAQHISTCMHHASQPAVLARARSTSGTWAVCTRSSTSTSSYHGTVAVVQCTSSTS
jgi:hypothetical protein